MIIAPSSTKPGIMTEVKVDKRVETKPRLVYEYEQFLSFEALHGLHIDDNGNTEIWSDSKFCRYYEIDRSTIWHWRRRTNFANEVHEMRALVMDKKYVGLVWRGVALRAAKGDAPQAQMILSQFGPESIRWQPPAQKHEVKISGLADLAKQARRKREREAIEGELVTDTNNA